MKKRCSVTKVQQIGAVIATNAYGTVRTIDVRYSDVVELNEDNYMKYSTTAPARSDSGISKIYYYGDYIEGGHWYCAVAKASPAISQRNLEMSKGETKAIEHSVKENPLVSYTSLNSSVATVSSTGLITARSVGEATIRIYVAPTANYKASVCEITVAVKNKANEPAVYKQKITATSKTVTYKSRAFSLKAKASAGGKLSYSSNNQKVAKVSKSGKVTVKNYGKATITIKASAVGKYSAATKKIIIKVVPKKPTLKTVKSTGKNNLLISWKKDKTVTGYQLQFCHVKSFKGDTYQKSFKASKTSAKVSGMKSRNYYVRIRAYKKVGKAKYYSSWSSIKK